MNNKFKRILNNVLNHIADFYFYFFVFYVFSLVLSLFFESWKLFFYWPAFHLSAIVFGILSLLSEKGKEFIKLKVYEVKKLKIKNFEIPNFEIPKIKKPTLGFKISEIKISRPDIKRALIYFTEHIVYFIKKFFHFSTIIALTFYKMVKIFVAVFRIAIVLAATIIAEFFRVVVKFFHAQINKTSRADFIKIGLTGIVLIFALLKGADVINFLILVYGLVSVLFVMEGRISALMALAFLIFVPIFLIIGNTIFAEKMAVFAYYFLIIAVATQIREYIRENSLPDGKHGKQKLSTNI